MIEITLTKTIIMTIGVILIIVAQVNMEHDNTDKGYTENSTGHP